MLVLMHLPPPQCWTNVHYSYAVYLTPYPCCWEKPVPVKSTVNVRLADQLTVFGCRKLGLELNGGDLYFFAEPGSCE